MKAFIRFPEGRQAGIHGGQIEVDLQAAIGHELDRDRVREGLLMAFETLHGDCVCRFEDECPACGQKGGKHFEGCYDAPGFYPPALKQAKPPGPREWRAGDLCTYLYKGPHGFALNPERFPAVVEGVTRGGRIRIRANAPTTGEFSAAVKPESLEPREETQTCD